MYSNAFFWCNCKRYTILKKWFYSSRWIDKWCCNSARKYIFFNYPILVQCHISITHKNGLKWLCSHFRPKEVRKLAEDFLVDYIQINIGSATMHANHNILQIVDVCTEYEKDRKLIQLLEEVMGEKENKTIIFCETKRKTDDITRRLRKDG